MAKADAALAALTPTATNLKLRFFGFLVFMTASQLAGYFERAELRILAMHAIADQAQDPAKGAGLHALAVTYEIQLARARNDMARVAEKLQWFFFSSRRRHTRSLCDWSSDVCSSDLAERAAQVDG